VQDILGVCENLKSAFGGVGLASLFVLGIDEIFKETHLHHILEKLILFHGLIYNGFIIVHSLHVHVE